MWGAVYLTGLFGTPLGFLYAKGNDQCVLPEVPERISKLIDTDPDRFSSVPRILLVDLVMDDELVRFAYNCFSEVMIQTYQRSNEMVLPDYRKWRRVNENPFYSPSNNYGYSNVFVNSLARKYEGLERGDIFSPGATIVKEAFSVNEDGVVFVESLHIFEKDSVGVSPKTMDWKLLKVDEKGITITPETVGKNLVKFCSNCHLNEKNIDYLFGVPKTVSLTPE